MAEELDAIYARRFPEASAPTRDALWRVLGAYLQRFVPEAGRVLDLACDRGDFIRNVRAAEKWACDLRDVAAELPPGVRFVQGNGLELEAVIPHDYFDLVFMSNYLEHLPDSDAVIKQLQVVFTLLRPAGAVLILQPNIRQVGDAYWDFIDHRVALTDRSLVEAAGIAGFHTKRLLRRFLPYTTKGWLPQHPLLLRAYLAFPLAWQVLGKQTLYLGSKP
jgi:ubiquinone/menaquinone biosynthesis C-methylase UbiE